MAEHPDLSSQVTAARGVIGGFARRTRVFAVALVLALAGIGASLGVLASVVGDQNGTIAHLQSKSHEQTVAETQLRAAVVRLSATDARDVAIIRGLRIALDRDASSIGQFAHEIHAYEVGICRAVGCRVPK